MKTTPEIQARIERLNREHPPAKGMEWRAIPIGDRVASQDAAVPDIVIGGMDCGMVTKDEDFRFGHYFRQVPAEAKDEDLEAVAKEAKAYAFAWCDNATKDADRLRYAYCAGFFKARSTQPKSGSDIAEQPAPGLDYERLFEVLGEGVVSYELKDKGSQFECVHLYTIKGASSCIMLDIVPMRNLPDDWTKSLRVRDLEPDEGTPRLTEVEFQRSAPGGEWERGHLLAGSAKGSRVGSLVLADDNCVLSVFRCRLRREGK